MMMDIFRNPDQIFLTPKDSERDNKYLKQLKNLEAKATDKETKSKIQKEIAIISTGIAGENNIVYELQNSHMDMVVLHDLYYETKTGHTAQIDFIVICSKMIFVIECKNLFGNIEINSKGDFVRTFSYGNKFCKEGIYSPITQNQRHMAVLKEKKAEGKNMIMTALSNSGFDDCFRSLVVLANQKTVLNDKYAKKEVKSQVYRADQLVNVIKMLNQQSKEPKFSWKEMQEIGNRWLARQSEHPDHRIDRFEQMISEQTRPNLEPENKAETKICPRCGSPMIKRIAKRGDNKGQEFWGCSAYPHCRYIEK